jgi:hypothetical protein
MNINLRRGGIGVKAKLNTLQSTNKVGGFRLDYLISKEKSHGLTRHSSGWLTAPADFDRSA